MTDRETLIELLREAEQSCVFNMLQGQEISPYFYFADYLISKGVTIPVRCEECENEQYCKSAQYLGKNGFCSYGERKEDDNKTDR